MATAPRGNNGSEAPGAPGGEAQQPPGKRASDINAGASPLESLIWDSANARNTLQLLRGYAEVEAMKAIDWYWRHKEWKARISRLLRLLAIVFTAIGGLLPIALNIPIVSAFMGIDKVPQATLLASLAIGLGASFVGLDSFFGFSSGWIRYVVTASQIRKMLEEFRMDWAMLIAKIAEPPSAENIELLVLRIKEFRLAIEDLVLEETRAWAAEFASNLARLEKEAKTQFESEQTQRDQQAKQRTESTKSGAMDISVTNGRTVDNDTFALAIQSPDGTVVRDTVRATDKWLRIGCAPGQYILSIEASLAGKPVGHAEVITVPPSGTAKATVTLR